MSKIYIDPDGKTYAQMPTIWNNSSPITEEYLLANGWTVQEIVVHETKSSLNNFLYEQKCQVAYTGVTIVKAGEDYTFETSQDSITMCNSTVNAYAGQPDTATIGWKVWKNGSPQVIVLTKAEFTKVFAFGWQMINTAFAAEGQYNQQVDAMTEEQLADDEYTTAFKNTAVETFSQIEKRFSIDDMNREIENE